MSRTRFPIGTLAARAFVAPAGAQSTTSPNVESSGLPGQYAYAVEPSLSADGRKVAFASNAAVLPGANFFFHIWVRDLATGVAVRASVDSTGVIANGDSSKARLSADGRWVAFASGATNLVPGDTNGVFDVFLHDLATGATTRESLDPSGAQVASACVPTSISADGRFVVFDTLAQLAATDTNLMMDVYVRDRVAGTTVHASLGTGGVSSAGPCSSGSISADGRRLAFFGQADDLVPGDSNGVGDVFLRNFPSGTTQLVSVASNGASGNAMSRQPVISGDGQSVAFASSAWNFTVPPAFNGPHVYVRDLVNSATTLIDVNASGAAPNAMVFELGLDIGHDGRFVAFASMAWDLVAGDTNHAGDVFLRDRLLGTTSRASLGAVGQQQDEGTARFASVSDDGRTVAFQCDAENLLPGDVNLTHDVFVHDFGATPPGASFCLGDGTGAACPCGNNGVVGRGCGHAADHEGAELFAMGVASIANDTLRLGARELPDSTAGYFLQGTSALGGGLGVPFGDGLRCIGGSVLRLAPLSGTGAQEAHYPGIGQVPISIRGQLPAAATTRYYQVWYRSAAFWCTPDTFNLTNGVRIDWTL